MSESQIKATGKYIRAEIDSSTGYYCQTCWGEGWMSADCMPPGEKCIDCNGTGREPPARRLRRG
jgi:DnaJ-class molecular chaperone